MILGELVGKMKDQSKRIKLIASESKKELCITAWIVRKSLGTVVAIDVEDVLCLEIDESTFNQFASLMED